MWTFTGLPLTRLGLKLGLAWLGLAWLGLARGLAQLEAHFGSVRLYSGPGPPWLGSGLGSKLGSTRLSPGSGLCSVWAGKVFLVLRTHILASGRVRVNISTVRPFWSLNAVLIRLAWEANEHHFFSSRFNHSHFNRFYQPYARDSTRPGSKLDSVRLEIAARLRARFSAWDSMTCLDLARGSARLCSSG